jgi:hypothetical protein
MHMCFYCRHWILAVMCFKVRWIIIMDPKSATRPLVGFSVVNDNLIKGLICFAKYMSRF